MSDMLTLKVPELQNSNLSDDDRQELVRFLEEIKRVANENPALIAMQNLHPNQQHLFIPILDPGKGTTKLTAVVIGNFQCWTFDLASSVAIGIELPHNLDTTKAIEIHLSWLCTAARTGSNEKVVWDMAYSFVPYNESEALTAPTHTGTLSTEEELIPVIANSVKHSSFVIDSKQISGHGEVIGIILDRSSTASDPASGTIAIQHIHVEYTSDKLGT